MTDDPVHQGRRRFLTNFLHESVVEPVAHERDKELEALRRELHEDAYEIGLRAWGPDLLAGSAEGLGVSAEGADYKAIAKALTDEDLEKNNQPDGDDETEIKEEREGKC